LTPPDLTPLENIIETLVHKSAIDPRKKDLVKKELENFIYALLETENEKQQNQND
jgi:hypothetical protein